jgi:cytidylate kinase
MTARQPLVIAVDGPAASGKTTLARRLAAAFDLPFLDTGLLYRAVARRLLDQGRAFDDRPAAVAAAEAIEPAELDPARLADAAIGQGASRVAAIGEVRTALIGLQRRFGGGRGAVLAGRDIGTVVRPQAVCKLFVTAAVEERARRRFQELQARDGGTIYERVLDELRERDARDRNRAVAPLVPASDAFVIDTTNRDADQAFAVGHAQVQAAARTHAPSVASLGPR